MDLEFAEPLDRAAAEDASRYTIYPLGAPGSPVAVYAATLVDTLYGRVVRLLLSGGPLSDSALYSIEVRSVMMLTGKSTGLRSVDFRTGLNYSEPIRNLFAVHCNGCHGAARAEGAYRTDSYGALFGGGTDGVPDLIAYDPTCLLILKTKPRNSMFREGNLSFLDAEIIRNWVVSYGARP